jgi:hypothetical protein
MVGTIIASRQRGPRPLHGAVHHPYVVPRSYDAGCWGDPAQGEQPQEAMQRMTPTGTAPWHTSIGARGRSSAHQRVLQPVQWPDACWSGACWAGALSPGMSSVGGDASFPWSAGLVVAGRVPAVLPSGWVTAGAVSAS